MQKLNPYLKLGVLLLSLLVSTISAGVYGILNDQITYTISSEYFTKFKYVQFGVNPQEFGGDRLAVAAIGFLATYWVGMVAGLVFGVCGLAFKNHKTMRRVVLQAILLTFAVTVCTGFAGFLYGKFKLANTGVDWWLPNDLVDRDSFIIVGSIHNFSYMGGVLGMVVGVVYLFANAGGRQIK